MEELELNPDSRGHGLRTATRALILLVINEGARVLADPMTDLILAGSDRMSPATADQPVVHAGAAGGCAGRICLPPSQSAGPMPPSSSSPSSAACGRRLGVPVPRPRSALRASCGALITANQCSGELPTGKEAEPRRPSHGQGSPADRVHRGAVLRGRSMERHHGYHDTLIAADIPSGRRVSNGRRRLGPGDRRPADRIAAGSTQPPGPRSCAATTLLALRAMPSTPGAPPEGPRRRRGLQGSTASTSPRSSTLPDHRQDTRLLNRADRGGRTDRLPRGHAERAAEEHRVRARIKLMIAASA